MTPGGLFPRETTQWSVVELPAWRAVARHVVAMAVLTGLLVRAFRAVVLTHGASSGLYLGVTFVLGVLVLCGMLTLHLANYPVRRWWWRVGAFALVETAAEMAVSALLVAAGREPLGSSGRAGWDDLPAMAAWSLGVRVVALALFAGALAAVVQLVRRRMPRHVPHAPGASTPAAGPPPAAPNVRPSVPAPPDDAV